MACRTPALRGASSGMADRAGSCRVRRRASRARSSRSGRPTTASSAQRLVGGVRRALPGEQAQRPQQGGDGEPGQRDDQPGQRLVGEQHEQRVLPVQPVQPAAGHVAPGAAGGCPPRRGARPRSGRRPPGGRPGWPASPGRRRRAAAAAGGSRPPSSSHTSRRTSIPAVPTASTARVPSCWPWSLLAALQPGLAPAAAGDRHADLEQQPAVAEAEHLGAGDRDLRVAGHLGQQLREGGRRGRAVVVQHPDPVGRRCQLEGGGDRRAEPGARRGGRRPRRCRARPASWPATRRCPRSPAPLVSAPTTVSGGRVWPASAVRRPGSHRSPWWATTTAVTVTAPVGSALSARGEGGVGMRAPTLREGRRGAIP